MKFLTKGEKGQQPNQNKQGLFFFFLHFSYEVIKELLSWVNVGGKYLSLVIV